MANAVHRGRESVPYSRDYFISEFLPFENSAEYIRFFPAFETLLSFLENMF